MKKKKVELPEHVRVARKAFVFEAAKIMIEEARKLSKTNQQEG